MRTLCYMAIIARPVNGVITFLAVLTAGFLLTHVPPLSKMIVAACAAMAIAMFGNTINDAADHKADRINKPSRMIPSGKLSVGQAWVAAIVYLAVGLFLSAIVGASCFYIAAFVSALLAAYSLLLKRVLLISNLVVSAISAAVFAYAAAIESVWTRDNLKFAAVGTVFVFIFHFGREILKDIEDMDGDRTAGTDTVPIRFGPRVSKALVVIAFSMLCVLMILAHFIVDLSVAYLVSASVLVILPLVIVLQRFCRSSDSTSFGRAQYQLKLIMPLGLLVLLIARYTI